MIMTCGPEWSTAKVNREFKNRSWYPPVTYYFEYKGMNEAVPEM